MSPPAALSSLPARALARLGAAAPPAALHRLSARPRLLSTDPLSTTEEDVDRYAFAQKHLMEGAGAPIAPIEMVSGEGTYVTAEDGRVYVDFTCGIGVTNLGHCHPRVVAAAQRQCAKLIHGSVAIGRSSPLIDLTARLLDGVLPASHDKVMYATTGAEAVENALRLARQATRRPNVIAFQGGYHGRTHLTVSLTRSKTAYGAGSAPHAAGIFVAPFPYETQQPGLTAEGALHQLDLVLKQQTAPTDTGAIIVEPVLGEGGYAPAPPGFLQGLRARCDDHGILLIVDEVQSGYGRTGRMFAHEESGVEPDILCVAKGIASGFPLSAISASSAITKHSAPGSMGGTYAANPVACAAAVATLNVFRDERILDNVLQRGAELTQGLRAIAERIPGAVKDVRGPGLMVGLELGDALGPGSAKRLSEASARHGLLLLNTSVFENVRFIPPLNITSDALQDGLMRFERALRQVAKEAPGARA